MLQSQNYAVIPPMMLEILDDPCPQAQTGQPGSQLLFAPRGDVERPVGDYIDGENCRRKHACRIEQQPHWEELELYADWHFVKRNFDRQLGGVAVLRRAKRGAF